MSERKITVENESHQVGSCALLILAIAICVVLFSGDPDIADLLREWLMIRVRAEHV